MQRDPDGDRDRGQVFAAGFFRRTPEQRTPALHSIAVMEALSGGPPRARTPRSCGEILAKQPDFAGCR